MSTCSSSSFRTLGTILHRVSTGGAPPLQCPFSSVHWDGWIRKSLSSSSPSSSLWAAQIPTFDGYCYPTSNDVRKIWTCTPVCMGRRSSKIATRKGAQDLKKGKLYSKIGKQVVSAVKKGGPNPISNPALATVLEKANELDVPKESRRLLSATLRKPLRRGKRITLRSFMRCMDMAGSALWLRS